MPRAFCATPLGVVAGFDVEEVKFAPANEIAVGGIDAKNRVGSGCFGLLAERGDIRNIHNRSQQKLSLLPALFL